MATKHVEALYPGISGNGTMQSSSRKDYQHVVQTYFTHDHFKCLNAWRDKVFDKSDSSHRKAYSQLREAYDITKQWANELRCHVFPESIAPKIIRRPIDQWHKKFLSYNWARIYPQADSPHGLAYTVAV